jgi:tRNA1(Val) A37 N6-methylase TrmN6
VSALNEIIAVKNDLKILQDRSGKRLKEYQVEVVNDELIVTDEDGELFEYLPTNKESQRIQETLFHEKQTIIENCLFGVDINPNSVKICRLRLWIELLKSAYYKSPSLPEGERLTAIGSSPLGEAGLRELETLPNIDINIKCGNSLVSRFALDEDLRQALKKSKFSIDAYRLAVDRYRNAESKEEKWEMEALINTIKSDFRSEIAKNDPKIKRKAMLGGELYNLTMQTDLFEEAAKEKKIRLARVEKVSADLNKLETEIEEIKANQIYENAFEWRFEFPEILNDQGDFVGFDVVIGNPPYVFGGNDGISENEKIYFKNKYQNGGGKINLFTLFIEKAFIILKNESQFGFIIPNTFLRVTSYDSTRRYLLDHSKINSIYDFGDKVFEDAVTTAIVITATKGKFDNFNTRLINESDTGVLSKLDIIENEYVIAINLDLHSLKLVKKLKANISLSSICKEMIFGVVITKNKGEVVSTEPIEGWKPFLEGKEIGPYYINEIKQWLNYDPKLLHRA